MSEMEVMWARRALAEAQDFLRGVPSGSPTPIDLGWHDSTTHPEVGSFAVVRAGGPLDDSAVGSVMRLSFSGREVFAYVVGGADVPTDLSLSRPLFARLALLSSETVRATMEEVQ